MFNEYSENQSKKILSIVMHFNQGKTISCEDVQVNNKEFTLSTGTYTFIGKEKTPHYSQMISLANCE